MAQWLRYIKASNFTPGQQPIICLETPHNLYHCIDGPIEGYSGGSIEGYSDGYIGANIKGSNVAS